MKLAEKAMPHADGVYACRQWYGWRILEWKRGRWVYVGAAAEWPVPREIFEVIVGPLPMPDVMEYDL